MARPRLIVGAPPGGRAAGALGALELGALVLGALVLGAFALAPAQALASASTPASSVSANWAGYVAVPSSSAAPDFSAVAGSWTVPAVSCTPGGESDSAAWVGLGGYREQSSSLEQIGSDADCARSGAASYGVWYELLPAGPVQLRLKVHVGDRLKASVNADGHAVTLKISDVSTGQRFATTRHVSRLDDSSAEWIVEAPSACPGEGACSILALADFGSIAFASATASAGSHTGPAVDTYWSASALELEQQAFSGPRHRDEVNATPARTVTTATPTASSAPYGSFAVSWQQQSVAFERPPPPTLPGFGGGAP